MRFFIILFLLLSVMRSTFALDFKDQRIVSLGPAITENLYLLGVGERIVGNTIYCKRPQKALKTDKIGNLININMERIITLEPDIVFVSQLTPFKHMAAMKKIGIRVEYMPNSNSFENLCKEFVKLGVFVGKKDLAEQMVDQSIKELKIITDQTEKLVSKKIFFQIGIKPLFTVNKESFINDMILFAGGKNVALETKSGIYSKEQVLMRDPEFIFITTMGIQGSIEKEMWQKYQTISAVKKGHLYIIDSYEVCSPSPNAFVETVKKMTKLIHPEVSL